MVRLEDAKQGAEALEALLLEARDGSLQLQKTCVRISLLVAIAMRLRDDLAAAVREVGG